VKANQRETCWGQGCVEDLDLATKMALNLELKQLGAVPGY
jgi:hypothetical protein